MSIPDLAFDLSRTSPTQLRIASKTGATVSGLAAA